MMGKRILVAEDNSLIRNLLELLLSTGGNRVDLVEDGLQAVTRMKETAYDLIVSDIQMPHLDGMEVLKEAQRLQPTARVVLMSGMDVDPDDIRRSGAFGFIAKPFTVEHFRLCIKSCLEASEARTHQTVTAG